MNADAVVVENSSANDLAILIEFVGIANSHARVEVANIIMLKFSVDPTAEAVCLAFHDLAVNDSDECLLERIVELVGVHASVLDDPADARQEMAHL